MFLENLAETEANGIVVIDQQHFCDGHLAPAF